MTFFISLMFQSYNAKIADFGLAKQGISASQSHVTTRVLGTYGYAAPEYIATGKLGVCWASALGNSTSLELHASCAYKFKHIVKCIICFLQDTCT